MPGFANSVGEAYPKGLVWLAGLLEAEGTFLQAPPSSPRCPVISCRMTDRDVVARVATMFGATVVAIDKGRYRTEFAAVRKGVVAVALMGDLMPLMGERRRKAIDAATSSYVPPLRKLSFEKADEIRRLYSGGESVSALSRSYAIARQTIHQILKREIYRAPKPTAWLDTPGFLRDVSSPPEGFSLPEFVWLAGWLEGEGSFLAPPPSDPGRPRISAEGRDRDVIEEVARLLEIKPGPGTNRRKTNWSKTWRVLKQGGRAATLMEALRPLMGRRRSAQIQRALRSANQAMPPATLSSRTVADPAPE
jgi:hypothetical protein